MENPDTCPHCKAESCIPEVAFRNVDAYGNNSFDVPCVHCGKMIRISLSRIVRVNSVRVSDKPRSEASF